MENKYYTPSTEEFHVGFECEIKNSSGKVFDWESFEILGVDDARITNNLMDWSFYDSERAIKDGQIRVKYLDSSDIESFGFTVSSTCGAFDAFKLGDRYKLVKVKHIGLTHSKNEITIFENSSIFGENYNDRLFIGDIKNKSELKQILKMIGVIE